MVLPCGNWTSDPSAYAGSSGCIGVAGSERTKGPVWLASVSRRALRSERVRRGNSVARAPVALFLRSRVGLTFRSPTTEPSATNGLRRDNSPFRGPIVAGQPRRATEGLRRRGGMDRGLITRPALGPDPQRAKRSPGQITSPLRHRSVSDRALSPRRSDRSHLERSPRIPLSTTRSPRADTRRRPPSKYTV